MLIRFSVSNFLSFKEPVEFSMVASKITRHKTHVQDVLSKRLLKGSFLFGPNASGKTNFIKAIDFARKTITNGAIPANSQNMCFRIDSEYRNKPGVFQFDFVSNGCIYSYGFVVFYATHEIVEEWLYQLADNNNETCIFMRKNDKLGRESTVTSDLQFSNKEDQDRFAVYKTDICGEKLKDKLFITDVTSRVSNDVLEFKAFMDTMEWFKMLIIIFPNSKYLGISELLSDIHSQERFSDILCAFDTGITSISKSKKDVTSLIPDLPPDIIEKIVTELRKDEKSRGATINFEDKLYSVDIEGDALKVDAIVADHGNEDDLFDNADESDGTKRLFDLIPMFDAVQDDHVIFIDEIDRSLHTMATMAIVKSFYRFSETKNAQLIATTHDSNLLDLDVLRQDEIWFFERLKDHRTSLYPLSIFKERFDKSIEKSYLIGRYGALPFLKQLDEISYEDGECDESTE